MGVTIGPEQRDALYEHLLDQLGGFEDLLRAVSDDDLEAAYRLGRRLSDSLRLILDGLGWGDHASGPVDLRMPPEELKRVLRRLREQAITLQESERPEQEEFRASWERTATVRHTCDEVLAAL